ncbi:hypothetical protein [Croceicoccus naphthovorans]|uniref:Uncharacterized protein n=1 Tax=Croceicoccus naphthovorans TaxID=1348774 RepID=A0A0G3XIW7_9SPHN|nr:hypothetical protein [Croceicoccus naphthovorans]AKM10544.1 hypothetical protein AB433_12150 [Croceicoccus naphthovorans]MBB3988743.1 hypothetical protein [Croceicoccus naphthovorans]
MVRIQALIAPAALFALSACASDTSRYPSLAIRDAERMSGSAAPAEPDVTPPPVPAQPPADLAGRLAAIADAASKSHATFTERARIARAKATRAEPGTLAWSDAEVALSSLESARSDTMFALADLDSMLATGAVDQAETGVPAGLPQILELRDRVAGLVAAEDAVLAEVRGR